jgi:hypothetical protein
MCVEAPKSFFFAWFLFSFGLTFVFQLFQLSDILLGQQTETFKLLPSTSLALVSFSLVVDDRTLDCVAKSVKEQRWWCAHIQYVHKALRPHGAKSISESLRKQQQVINDAYANESIVCFSENACVCLKLFAS